MQKKAYRVISLSTAIMLLATGCGSGEIEKTEHLTLDEVAGKRLASITSSERDKMVFDQVSGRIVVDKTNLVKISEEDMKAVMSLLGNVEDNLRGTKNNALIQEYANYLLMEFAKTPYEWKRKAVEGVGYDPATRLYFVDVTYSTTDKIKTALPTSKIVEGSPMEETLKEKRYEDYIKYIDAKLNMDEKAEGYLSQFITRWGSVEGVKEEQQGVSLLERTRKKEKASQNEITQQLQGLEAGALLETQPQQSNTVGKLTYNGLVSDSKLNKGATMTIRYVMKYRYNLGEETDLMVDALYLKDYKMEGKDEILKSYNGVTKGIDVLKPFVDRLLLSYNKAVETTNHIGLYQLHDNYGTLDKYYSDLGKYTYTTFGGYTYEILEREGNKLAVKVDRLIKTRAKGTEMSMPTYKDTSIFNIVLDVDDTLKIKSVYPLETRMIGEPMSVISNVSGVSDIINYSAESFTDANEEKIKETLKKFSKAVMKASVDCPEFRETVDMGVSQVVLKKMADAVTAIEATKKTTYLVNWATKSNTYVSLTLRDIFETANGNYDTESVVDLANIEGEWKIVDYTRVLSVQTEKAKLDTKDALCIDTK